MRKRSKLSIALVPVAAIILSVVANLATNDLPSRFRPPAWAIWIVFAVLAVLVVSGEVRSQRRKSDKAVTVSTDNAMLSEATMVLARAVKDQWRAEADIRSLNHPEPIRVRWASTERPVSASPSSVLGAAIPAGRPVRLHLRGDVTQIVEMFNRLPYRQLVILGAPGAGKSVMALLLTLKMLATREKDAAVPVLLSVSSWNPTREHLLAWTVRRIREDYLGLANADLYGNDAPQRLLSEGKIIPVLDGLDEIPRELRAESISGMVQAFGRDQPFIITCRIEEYEDAVAAGDVLGSAAVVEILPIDTDQIIAYLSSLGPANHVRWTPVFTRLRQDPSGPIAMALSTPLTVWLARTTYGDVGSKPEELLDSTRFDNKEAIEGHLLDKFIPAVYKARPPAPGDPPRMRVDPRDADRWLRFLARSLSRGSAVGRRGKYIGDQTDIAWWRLYETVPPVQLGLATLLIVGPLITVPIILALEITSQLTAHRLLAGFICLGIVLLAGAVMAIRLWPPPPGRIHIRLPRPSRLPGNLRAGLMSGGLADITASLAAGMGALELKSFGVALIAQSARYLLR